MSRPHPKIQPLELKTWFPHGVPIAAVKIMFPEQSHPLTVAEIRHVLAALAAIDPSALDTKAVEAAARDLALEHYVARFEKPAYDPHVQKNVDANWHIFAPSIEKWVRAYMKHMAAGAAA